MPTIQIVTPPTPEAEPVTLALANAALRLDLDLVSTDAAIVAQREYLALLLSAARQKVESYTGRYYAAQTLRLTYTLDEGYTLPAGAVATAVEGFYATLEALATAGAFLEEYRKGISVSRELDWHTALAQTYTVTADVTPDPAFLALAKLAMLELAGEWYKNRETTVAGSGSSSGASSVIAELPVSWKIKLRPAVLNPLGAY